MARSRLQDDSPSLSISPRWEPSQRSRSVSTLGWKRAPLRDLVRDHPGTTPPCASLLSPLAPQRSAEFRDYPRQISFQYSYRSVRGCYRTTRRSLTRAGGSRMECASVLPSASLLQRRPMAMRRRRCGCWWGLTKRDPYREGSSSSGSPIFLELSLRGCHPRWWQPPWKCQLLTWKGARGCLYVGMRMIFECTPWPRLWDEGGAVESDRSTGQSSKEEIPWNNCRFRQRRV